MARHGCTAFVQTVTEQQSAISGTSKQRLMSLAHAGRAHEINGMTGFSIGIYEKRSEWFERTPAEKLHRVEAKKKKRKKTKWWICHDRLGYKHNCMTQRQPKLCNNPIQIKKNIYIKAHIEEAHSYSRKKNKNETHKEENKIVHRGACQILKKKSSTEESSVVSWQGEQVQDRYKRTTDYTQRRQRKTSEKLEASQGKCQAGKHKGKAAFSK